MADFKAGDRVVKMSGFSAGKYGTVNGVLPNGTLNVTFDGERLPRYCDPERCGQVAANAKFKVGDKVRSAKYPELGEMKVVRVFQDIHGTAYRTSRDGFLTDDIHYDRTLIPANSRAANAKGERVIYDLIVNPVGRDKFKALQRIGMTIKQAQRGVDIVQKWQTKSVREEDAANGDMSKLNEIWKRNAEGCAAELEAMRRTVNSRSANAVRNERIRAYPDGPGEWILVDSVGDEGVGRTTATDERGIKAQLADIAVRTYRWHRPEIVIMREKYYSNAARNAVARNAGRFELVEHNMGRSFGVYDSATSGYIADDISLRDALRILKTKGETADQAKKDLYWTDPAAIDRLW